METLFLEQQDALEIMIHARKDYFLYQHPLTDDELTKDAMGNIRLMAGLYIRQFDKIVVILKEYYGDNVMFGEFVLDEYICLILSHEWMHRVLDKHISDDASIKLDNPKVLGFIKLFLWMIV